MLATHPQLAFWRYQSTYTFKLRKGVKFHSNAKQILGMKCHNIKR